MTPSRSGFTLIEVLAAVLILGIVGTTVLTQTTTLVDQLARSRDQYRAAGVAEAHARELLTQMSGEELPEPGVMQGQFEGEYEDLTWELEVEAYPMPVPEERARDRVLSSVFTEPGTRSRDAQPSVLRLLLRVFREDLTGERVEATDPFVLFAVRPLTAEEIAGATADDDLPEEEPE